MNKKIVETLFPGTTEKVKNKVCPTCNKPITEFKDKLSKKEYGISGMCQECQDKTFNPQTGNTTQEEAEELLFKIAKSKKQDEVNETCSCESICAKCLRGEVREYQHLVISELEKLGWRVTK